jgi:small subunit ribosomal protein S6
MREYEFTIVLKPDLDDDVRNELIQRVETMLTHGDGEEDKPTVNHWGQRILAYPIKKYNEGYYVLYEANLDPTRISDIERTVTYIDDILRHLVVRKDS